jgi:uncharacterized membrane protein
MSAQLQLDTLVAPQLATAGALTRSGRPRLDAIDILRGLVIVLMVLDHVRDFFHSQAFLFNPTDPTRTTIALYATRWVTHLCAPTFVFLAGVSAYLQGVNGKAPGELARFLAMRGIWLLVLELTIIGFGLNFAPIVFLQVIWAIGISMLLLALLVRLRAAWIGALGMAIVAGHGLLEPIDAAELGSLGPLWLALFEIGPLRSVPGFLAYPVIPWFGVMCLGYGLGFVFTLPATRRRRLLAMIGTGALLAFVLLRALNGYGDPAPWRSFPNASQTVLSFLNVSKYPPSLLYVLVTLGISCLLLPVLERLRGPIANVLLAFGRTPLFTFVLHIYVAHGAALLLGVLAGLPASLFANFILDPSRLVRAQWGFSLVGVYVAWLAVLAVLYPLASWFAEVKRRRRDWWLSYA